MRERKRKSYDLRGIGRLSVSLSAVFFLFATLTAGAENRGGDGGHGAPVIIQCSHCTIIYPTGGRGGDGGNASGSPTSPEPVPMNEPGLRLCNRTSSGINAAIGYHDNGAWVSEGWWNVKSKTCALLVRGKLRKRYYYVYAHDYDKGGAWGGAIKMCTNNVEFTIRGTAHCTGRGFKTNGFFQVDTGEQIAWTVQLIDTGNN